MGTTYSLLEKEKATWGYHCLLFDEDTREANLKLLESFFPEGSEIQLAKRSECRGGLTYQHFFITDTNGVYFLELTSLIQNSDAVYDTHRVQCNTLPHSNYAIVSVKDEKNAKEVTPDIKERMIQMLGMCNYSLCLRNSEHVANYIFSGLWASFQMEKGGYLFYHFESKMTKDGSKKINTFPSSISPKTVGRMLMPPKLYSIIDKQYNPTGFQYYSDGNENSYNILVVGKASEHQQNVMIPNLYVAKKMF